MPQMSEETRSKLASRLRHRRLELKLTQLEAAHEIGVGYESYVKWERGTNFPEMPNLRKVEEAFELDLTDLAIEDMVGKTASVAETAHWRI